MSLRSRLPSAPPASPQAVKPNASLGSRATRAFALAAALILTAPPTACAAFPNTPRTLSARTAPPRMKSARLISGPPERAPARAMSQSRARYAALALAVLTGLIGLLQTARRASTRLVGAFSPSRRALNARELASV